MKSKKLNTVICSLAISVAVLGWDRASAAVTVTPASGGTNIAAATAVNGPSPAWTPLGTASITEPSILGNGNFAIGTNATLVLKAPAGFQFNTSPAPAVNWTSGKDIMTASIAVSDATTLTITLTVTNTGARDTLNITGMQVQPTAVTPLHAGSHIYRPTTGGGSAVITGVNASSDGSTGDSFGDLNEVAGPVTQLVFSSQPTNVTAGSVFATQPVVKSRDQFGNDSTNGLPASSYLTVSLTSGAGPLQGTTALDIGTAGAKGVAAFTNLRLDVAGNDKQLTASSTNGLPSVMSGVFTVIPAPASQLFISQPPSLTATAGVVFAQQPILYVEDAYNNLSTTNHFTVTAARAAGAGTLQGTTSMTAAGGVVTFTNLAHGWATNITIQFSSGTLTPAVSDTITVNAGPYSKLLVVAPGQTNAPGTSTGRTGTAASQNAGTNFSVTVLAVDSQFNPLSYVTDMVRLTSSDSTAVLPPNAALINGSNSFNVTLKNAGLQTVTAKDTSGSQTGTSSDLTVNALGFSQLQVLMPGENNAPGTAKGKSGSPNPQLTGTACTVTVKAVDAYWNIIWTNDTVHLTSSDPAAALPADAAMFLGSHSFSVTFNTASNQTVMANDVTDPNIATNTGSATTVVLPGTIDHYNLSASSPKNVGVPFTVTVTAKDIFGNTVTNDSSSTLVTLTGTGSVDFDSNGDGLYGDASKSLVHGVFSINTRDLTAETVLITASDTNGNSGILLPTISRAVSSFQSVTNGNWGDTNTWQAWSGSAWVPATVTPNATNASAVFIHTNTVTVVSDVTVDQVVMDSGGSLVVTNATLTVTDGGLGGDLDVSGTLSVQGTGTVSPGAGAQLVFQSSATYAHYCDGGAIPVATWASGSGCVVYGTLSNTPSGLGQAFGNFTWDCAAQSADIDLGGNLTNIQNGFNLFSTGTGRLIGSTAPDGYTMNVGGYMLLLSGTFIFDAADGGPGANAFTLNVGTGIGQTAGLFSQATSQGDLTINFLGNASFTQLGGTFGPTNMNFNVNSGATLTLLTTMTVTAGHSFTVNGTLSCLGEAVVAGGGDFTLNPNTEIVVGSTNGLSSAPGTGSIQVSGTVTLSPNALYRYYRGVPQVTGNALPPAVSQFTIDNNAGVTLTGDLTVTNTLLMTAGDITTGPQQVILPSGAVISGAKNSSYVNGKLQKAFAAGAGQSFAFPVGDATRYAPVSLSAFNVTQPGSLTVSTTPGEHPNVAASGLDSAADLNRYWTLAPDGSLAASYNATFNYLPADIDAGATVSQFVAMQYNSGAWSAATLGGIPTTNTTLITADSSFGDFAVGDIKRDQTITFNSLGDQTYGVAPLTLTATASSGLPVSYSVISGPATVLGSNLTVIGTGPIVVQASQPGNGSYNPALPLNQSFNVGPAGLLVTADNKSRPYSAPNPPLTVSYSGFVNGDSGSVLSGAPGLSTTANTSSLPGTYPISVSQGSLAAANYSLSFSNGTLTVLTTNWLFLSDDFSRPTDPGDLSPWIVEEGQWTVTGGVLQGASSSGGDYPMAYVAGDWRDYNVEARLRFPGGAWGAGLSGRLDPATGNSYAAIVLPSGGGGSVLALVKGQGWFSGGWMPMASVGVPAADTNWHNLKLSFRTNEIVAYYDGTPMLDVTDAGAAYTHGGIGVVVFANTPSQAVFDDVLVTAIREVPVANPESYSAVENATLVIPAPGVLANDVPGPGTNLSAVLVTSPANGSVNLGPSGGFSYTPATNFAGSDSFTYQANDGLASSDPVTVSVNVRPALSVTADNQARAYGQANPPLTGSLVGVQPGDGITASYATVADTNSPIGAYPILPVFNDPNNTLSLYLVTTNLGTLTVTQAVLTVSADAQGKFYGDSDPGLTYQITSGSLFNSDSLGGALLRVPGETVGDYAIQQGTLSAGSNYALMYQGANLSIAARPITVSADPKSKVYGDGDPALTYQITSGNLVGMDGLSGALARVAGEDVGSYPILQGTINASSNYQLTYQGTNLTITMANSATALASSQNPSGTGTNVVFTATVTAVAPAVTTPTGSVQFLTNGAPAGSAVGLNGGVASLGTATLPAGSNTVTAVYLGDTNFQISSNSLLEVINASIQPPSLLAIRNNGDGSVTITFQGTPGAQYVIKTADDVISPVWTTRATPTADSSGSVTFTDSDVLEHQARYYRALTP